jgi:uncharacterized protein (DUF2235 family)
MSKRLIVCCDGTWNRADQPCPTNVKKLYEAVDQSDAAGQVAWYEPGVGTRPLEHLIGGAFGIGLSRNVQRCYRWLVDRYEPEDELFFFGFSRGAFTARSLAGLVRNSGILRREKRDMVEAAYKLYRSREPGNAPWEENANKFRDDNSHPLPEIRFIGVWDTVGALGIPVHALSPPWLTKKYAFHDTTLSSYVKNAYHALSIDERRGPFEPTLWVRKTKPGGGFEPMPADQTVEQVWFAGVHSDVGGGYPEPALAEIALKWIANRAHDCGLVLKPGHLEPAPDPLADAHDSMRWYYNTRWLKPYDRKLKAREGDPVNAWLSHSANVRYDGKSPQYRPPGLHEWMTGGKPVAQKDD